jgi:prephenate dehydratase
MDEPVIHTLGTRFGLVTTIRRANLEEGSGWVILEMDGSPGSISDALAWLAERGVQVDRIDEG